MRLLTTVSAAVLLWSLGAAGRPARAAETVPHDRERWSIAFEGQPTETNGERLQWWNTATNAVPEFVRPNGGWAARTTITYRPEASDLRYALNIRYGESITDTTFTYPGNSKYTGDAHHRETHTIVDFEVGRDVGLGWHGATSVASTGLRFADFSANTASAGNFNGYLTVPFSNTTDRHFTGVGPRVAWDVSVPLLRDVPISLDTQVAGALLFGNRSLAFAFSPSYTPVPAFSRSTFAVVPNLELSAAFSMRLNPASVLSVGYRADAYFDVLDGGGSEGYAGADRIIGGPFVRYTHFFR